MSFFYDLNKKLDGIRATPEVTHKQLNERDMSRAAKGIMKYGKDGMQALRDAEAEGKALGPVRKKYNKYDNKEVDEGVMDTVKSVGKKVAGGINKLVGHGSDEDMIKDLQRKSGAPVTGKKPEQKTTEAAKYRDPKYKDKLYTQEPPDYTYGPDMDDAYYNPKPDDYAGKKRKIGGGEFPSTDPLERGQGIGRSGIKNNILDRGPRKGLPSRDQITSLKGSIKSARGTHAEPNLPEAGAPMTAKQKSFAKLAPPADKITFADKIAGAKKEVDEMLGDVAAEAMRSALGGGRGRNAEMDEDNAFDYKTPRSMNKGEKKTSSTGGEIYQKDNKTVVHTAGRHYGGGDEPNPNKEKRTKAGRPDGTGKKIGAKGPSGKSKLMTREGDVDVTDQGEYDQEGDMAKDDIKTIVRHAQALSKVLGDDDNLPEWVQSKLAKIEGMMISIDEYMQNQEGDDDSEEPIAEKAVSKKQQKFMGMVHAAQKGEKPASKEVGKVAKTMKKKDAEDFAKTKHKGLPEKAPKKKKEEDVEESTTSAGAVATSSATTGSKGGVYGKGIYDSMNFELEQMIAESMSINMSDSTEGGKSLSVTATDDDAMKLAMMLKAAGIGGGDQHGGDMHSHGEEPCDTCGMPDCGCGDVQEAVDENSPDWPTNTETSDDALQYAGGLNKPKTDVAGDGQTTIPNTAVHTQDEDALRRMMEMAGLAEAAKPDFLDMDKDGDKEESMKDAVKDKEEVEEDFLESIQRMREIAGIQEAKKPDFLDMDKDGDKKEPMSKAIKDKEEKKVDESIFALTNQWQAYKG